MMNVKELSSDGNPVIAPPFLGGTHSKSNKPETRGFCESRYSSTYSLRANKHQANQNHIRIEAWPKYSVIGAGYRLYEDGEDS